MKGVNERRLTELETIKQKHGGILKPEHVVEFARDPATAVHGWFDWSDASAAEKYRLEQARMLIRIMVATVDGASDPVRVNVSIMEDRKQPGGGYRSLEDVMADPDMRRKVLKTALVELSAARRRYKALNELAEVFSAIDEAEKQHGTALEDSQPAKV